MSIKVENLQKKFGNQQALKNISFEINKGEIVGFLGPNGAGKSTLMKILTTSLLADEGCAWVNDYDVVKEPFKVQQSVGYLAEHNPLYLDLYVREYLQFHADIHKIKKERIEEIISLTGLTPEVHKKINQLSKGYRQRIGLASAMLHNPSVLILDEPTTGLDPNQLVEIRQLIKNIGKDKTVLLSTHIMQEVEAICDRVLIIKSGELVEDKKITNRNQLPIQQTIIIETDKEISEEIWMQLPLAKVINANNLNYHITFESEIDMRASLFDFAANHQFRILSMQAEKTDLETLFRHKTKSI